MWAIFPLYMYIWMGRLFCHTYVRSGLPMVFAFVEHTLPMLNNSIHLSWILFLFGKVAQSCDGTNVFVLHTPLQGPYNP